MSLLLFGTARIAGATAQQDDPFDKLKSYDFQSRQSVEAIRMMIDRSLGDKTATAQIEQKLDDVLADPKASFAGRQEAARFLWIIGTGRSVPVLAKLLDDEKLSDVARYALERDSDPAAGKALVDALPPSTGRIRVGLINSIGNRGDAEAVPALKQYVTDSDPLVAEAATVAIGKIGTPSAVAVLKTLPASNATAGVALRRTAEKLAAAGKRTAAAQVYGLLWSSGRPSNIRGEAVRGLANIGAPNAASVALAALRSGDPYVEIVAAQVVGSMEEPRVVGQALAQWQALAVPTQVALLTVLGERRAGAVAPVALKAMQSTDPALRAAGIRAAGRAGAAPAVPRLIDVMLHGEGADRNVARDALAGMPGPEAERAILEQVRQGTPEARAALMGVLVDRPSPTAVAALGEAAHGSDVAVATAAIRALARVGGAKEQGDLIGLLVSTASADIRDASRDALVAIGQRMGDPDRTSAPVLTAYATASEPAKSTLLSVLAEAGGDRSLEELTRAAGSSDPELKQAAVRALAETWQDSRPLPTLLATAKSDPNNGIRVQALRGYLRLVGQDDQLSGQVRAGRIADALKIADRPEEKRQALSLLRDIRTPDAVEVAAPYLSDPELFPDAASAILDLAGPQRRNNRNLAAVKGAAMDAALDKIIQTTKDDDQRALAQRLRGQN
jgi:HEAT repeat protein